MQGDDGFRIDADVLGIAHQIFDGRLVVEDHLGFQCGSLAGRGLAMFDQSLGIEP